MIIPLQAIANQKLTVDLNGQICEITLLTRGQYLYASVSMDEEVIIKGRICRNKGNIIPGGSTFNGSIYFEDLVGDLDPIYIGLGTRWVLNYAV